MRAGHEVIRWVGAIGILIAAALGAHAQATKKAVDLGSFGEPMVIGAASVESYWAGQLLIAGDNIPIVLILHQDDELIRGEMGVGHSDFRLTGTLKGNEIMLSISIPSGTLEFKGEVKGDAMEGAAATRNEKGRWSVTRFTPPPQ
jgi:hypothetical protein